MRIREMIKVMIPVVAVLLLIGCTNARRDFEKAQKEDTVNSYKAFLDRHPNSKYNSDAQKCIEYLNQISVISQTLEEDDPTEKAKAIMAIRSLEKSSKLYALVPSLISSLDDRRMVWIIKGMTFLKGIAVATGKEGGSARLSSVAGEAVESLKFITGESFGRDKEKWEHWWTIRKDKANE